MSYDVLIKGGSVADGRGGEPVTADVAISGDRIVEVGRISGQAKRTIDADGALVTPGFVDIHTHYDGQVSWDADLAPSCFHGVTTCVMGNCGVGFAPVRPSDHARLIELMEGVEDIPGSALAEGLTWDWESFESYMDAVDAFPHAIDFAVQVPHDAVRVFVMGERGAAGEPASEAEIAEMRDLVQRALAAGAFGFSTGRSDNHRSSGGEATPAAEANKRELVGIAAALRGDDHRVLQAVSDFDMEEGEEHFDREFDLLEAMVAATEGKPLSISLLQRDQAVMQWQRIIERAEQADAAGHHIRLQAAPRAIGVLLGLEATFNPFMGFPSYKRVCQLPLPERVAAMRDPAFKAKLLTEKSEPVSGDGSPIPPLADKLLERVEMVALRLFKLGAVPDYEPAMERSIYAAAHAAGQPALSAVYDALLEQEGRELLYFPLYNYAGMNLDDVGKMLRHPLTLPGLSDGGAHVGTICDASFPTFMLTHWTRDRDRDRLSVGEAVKMQTHDTAQYLGMRDRGVIAEGMKADVNVIDYDNLRLLRPRLVHDLPAGGRRLLQDAEGYRATLVSGRVITENGTLSGDRPGRLVRAS